MLRPFKIWTQYQSFIVYANNAETLQDYVPQKIIRSRACFSWYDKLIRFAQRFFIPIRIRKYEYIHLLEVIGQAHVTTNLTQQLNNILSAPHSRHFRYQLCEFLHQLKLGHPLPLSFSRSFDSLTEHMNLLKSPLLQNKMSEITPFIIQGLDQQISCKAKIYSTLLVGLVVLTIVNAAAYVICRTEFTRLVYMLNTYSITVPNISYGFLWVFYQSKPTTFISYIISYCIGYVVMKFFINIKYVRYIADPIKLKLPFIGKLIAYRNAYQLLFCLELCQKLSLDFDKTNELCSNQLQNMHILKLWQNSELPSSNSMYIEHMFNFVFESIGITLSSHYPDNVKLGLHLVNEEVHRREKNLVLFFTFTVISINLALILWGVMAYFGLRGELSVSF